MKMSIENEKIKLQIIYHSILQKIKPPNKLPQVIEIKETEFPGSLNLDKEILLGSIQKLNDFGVIKFLGISKEDPVIFDGEYVGDTPFFKIKVLKWVSLSSILQNETDITNKFGSTHHKLELENKPLLELSTDAQWRDMEIKFLNQYDIDIYFKGKFLKKSNHEEMGFFRKGTKDKKPDKQWKLLELLSVIYSNKKHAKATIEIISQSLRVSKDACMKIKEKLNKKLQEVFGIYDTPFFDYGEKDEYQAKFKLKPESELRGNGEVFIARTRYDDKIGYKILDE